jgi:hypothetical protein
MRIPRFVGTSNNAQVYRCRSKRESDLASDQHILCACTQDILQNGSFIPINCQTGTALFKFQCPIFCYGNSNKYHRTMHTFPQNKFIICQQKSI